MIRDLQVKSELAWEHQAKQTFRYIFRYYFECFPCKLSESLNLIKSIGCCMRYSYIMEKRYQYRRASYVQKMTPCYIFEKRGAVLMCTFFKKNVLFPKKNVFWGVRSYLVYHFAYITCFRKSQLESPWKNITFVFTKCTFFWKHIYLSTHCAKNRYIFRSVKSNCTFFSEEQLYYVGVG